MTTTQLPGPTDASGLAERFNLECPCGFLDRAALGRELAAATVLGGMGASSSAFSDTVVLVSEEDLSRIEAIVAAIERIGRLPAWQARALQHASPTARFDSGALGVFYGFDFHLGPHGPQLIEINTNAGGAWLNAALRQAQVPCCPETAPWLEPSLSRSDLEARWLSMFAEEHRLCRGGIPLRRVAIIDTDPDGQFLHTEFVLAREMFRRAGMAAWIADPRALHWDGHRLRLGGVAIDLVYNRLTDFALEHAEQAALKAAYLARAVCLTPHPRAHALLADKRRLIDLCSRQQLVALGANPEDAALVAAHVPETRIVDDASREALWRARRHYFFKPADGFGSRAAYRGDKLTRRVWQTLLGRPYVAQQLVPPALRLVGVGAGAATLKTDLRAYVHDGQVQLLAARLYQGQTTNMRTPGGGFAPVLVLPPQIDLQ